jgi:hypothetical protein
MKMQKEGKAELGWITGASPKSEDRNDVVILKNHEPYPDDYDMDSGMSSDEDDYIDEEWQA